ncbi:MAG TPA: methionine--tRNA ligase [Candidatus Absconditabacterales bacterium]|nr:methionine--tRNA ligase [Candidatus Absconditabacterales bacterium]
MFITTTLPYVNSKLHIGHALEFVQADVIARWMRSQGIDVFFNVGTDEHGLKILQKATEQGMEVQAFVDHYAGLVKEFFDHFGISYDSLYRTSDQSHTKVAQTLWNACMKNGDIYQKTYSGLYCVGCEGFKTPKDLIDGKCPDHGTIPQPYEEENYFFRLSHYREPLIAHLQSNQCLIPETKLTELINFVQSMEDISISRNKANLPWGIPVPNDENQVMYVWFDALSNYIGAVGYPDNMDRVHQLRPGIQLFGPDNLRFQGAIRQGMLASGGLPFTKHLLCHGMVLGPDGNKMSKTLGNTIDPIEQLESYGLEAVRYYLIAGLPTYADGSYKVEDLVNLYNSHLADSFGNLVNRVITISTKKDINLKKAYEDKLISEGTKKILEEYHHLISLTYNEFQLNQAANYIHDFVLWANKYIDEIKPWDKNTTGEQAQICLQDLSSVLYQLCHYYSPIIPTSINKALSLLDKQEKGILFEKIVPIS